MVNRIRDFFSSPVFDDVEKNRIANTISILCIVICLGIIIPIIHNWVYGLHFAFYILVVEEVFILISFWMVKRGAVKLSAVILSFSLLAMATYLISTSPDGFHDVALLIFPAIIGIASLLFNKRLFLIFTLLIVLVITGIVYAEVNGIFIYRLSSFTSYRDLTDAIIIILITAIMAGLLTDNLKDSLSRSRVNENFLAEINHELEIQAEQLRASKEKYRMITENISDLIAQVSRQGLYTYLSPSYETILGYKSEELIGKNPNDYVHPDDLQNISRIAQDAILQRTESATSELRSRHKDGTYKWFEASLRFFYDNNGNLDKLQMVSRDITERKKYEDALQMSALEWQSTFDAVNDSVILLGTDNRILRHNKATQYFFNNKSENILGKRCWEVIHNRLQPLDDCPLIKMEKSLRRESLQMRSGNKWFEVNVDPILDTHGKIVGIVHITSDITTRKIAEDALEDEKERLLVTLRSIGDGVITTDVNGIILLMNEVAEQLTGWSMEEAAGKSLEVVFNIFDEFSRVKLDNPVGKVLLSGNIAELDNHTLLISRDGTERTVADSVAPISDKDGKIIGVVLVFRDVTGKQHLEESLRNAQKLESIGVMAGGIAHDFNNLLNGIFGYMDLAQQRASDSQKVKTYLEKAFGVFERARLLTQQLFTFAKGGLPVKKIIAIEPFLKNNVSFVLSGSNIVPEFNIPDDLWNCEIDENQIGQAIDNIVLNAVQASSEGGAVVFRAENIPGAKPIPGQVKPADYVRISVQDRGIGIEKLQITKIFDPFYTTKQNGSGLGLTTAYSIIRKHDGHIEVESDLGKGTTFHVYLPAIPDKDIIHKSADSAVQTGKEKILLMDDEPYILEVARDMLEILGYKVVCTSEGRKAIHLFQEAKAASSPFDVVILDLTIQGGMGGKETIRNLLKIDPLVKAIASSGYSEDPILADPKEYGFTGGLKKPYRKMELATVLKEVISGGKG